MNRIHTALVAAALGWLPAALAAHEIATLAEQNGILIEDGYARAAGAAAKTGAGYMAITNQGAAPDRLLAVESDAARRVELHTTILEGGVARMRMIEGGLVIAPGETVVLDRGGAHVMFMGLTEPFAAESTVAVTLVFEKAGRVPVAIPVDLARDTQTPVHRAGH